MVWEGIQIQYVLGFLVYDFGINILYLCLLLSNPLSLRYFDIDKNTVARRVKSQMYQAALSDFGFLLVQPTPTS